VVYAHNRDFSRVQRPVPAPAFAVIIRGVRVETGAPVVGVAFGFFGRGFFFDFAFFGPLAFPRFLPPFFCFARPPFAPGDQPCPPPRRLSPGVRLRSMSQNGAPLRLLAHLPRLRAPLFFGFAVRAAAAA
jgi:hypothetical protein